MERAALDQIQRQVEDDIKARFPGGGIDRVAVLQYGDDPAVEPGELTVLVFVAAEGEPDERERVVQDFNRAFTKELKQMRDDLTRILPQARHLEFQFGEDKAGPGIVLASANCALDARALAGGELTPVMARLGPTDLQTLDTLITAGIASNRADAVRWALARIRERPAYEQLRAKAREIEELKGQF